jgi:hypothetical protein
MSLTGSDPAANGAAATDTGITKVRARIGAVRAVRLSALPAKHSGRNRRTVQASGNWSVSK